MPENPVPQARFQPAPAPATFAADPQFRGLLLGLIALALVFCVPLQRLFTFAWSSDLYSFMILMPVVAAYLLSQRQPWKIPAGPPLRKTGVALALASLLWLALSVRIGGKISYLMPDDLLAISTGAFLAGVAGVTLLTLGWERAKAALFPLGMLVFMTPFPTAMREGIEEFLQYGSAYAAYGMFRLAGMPTTLTDLDFTIPGTPGIRVAPECSGIHSTYILLITSLLAGYLFLRSPWKRLVLAAFVLPLALVRNGFRIFTIGELCYHYGAQMIDAWIHRKGGPVFFALSLAPFFLLLAWLRSRENRRSGQTTVSSPLSKP